LEDMICRPGLTLGRIQHAVFDFDGTLSILREGWEAVMEPMMVESICGNTPETQEIREKVQRFIDESTGIQTILQMQNLVQMVHDFGRVPKGQILDAWGYKKIYNDRLLQNVNERIRQLKSGAVERKHYLVQGGTEFVQALRERGVHLYLASGTDLEDVQREAELLDFAKYFDGGIYGSIRSVEYNSKERVMQNIITDHQLSGPELLVIGDGPVEMRIAKTYNAMAMGVASDEKTGCGWNQRKIERLQNAGADFLIADFSKYEELIRFLFTAAQS
jgi:phosphoglycolate phosphatase-like HAD superfamily hydrolase